MAGKKKALSGLKTDPRREVAWLATMEVDSCAKALGKNCRQEIGIEPAPDHRGHLQQFPILHRESIRAHRQKQLHARRQCCCYLACVIVQP